IQKTGGNYPAPLEALATVRSTISGSFYKGLATEADRFSHLAVTELSKDLIRIYFLSEAAKKSPPADTLPGAVAKAGSAKPVAQIHRVGVVGAGVMGGGIAWLFAN